MFETLTRLPTDPILGLLNQYRDDTNPAKVDLGVGVYKDEAGHTPILSCVKQAEQQRLTEETSKVYIGPAGAMPFNKLMTELAFGHNHPALLADRIRTVSTPGGTGALKVAADFIQRCQPGAVIWVSDPTWANHSGLFQTAGLTVKTYPYYDYDNQCIKFDAMCQTLAQATEKDVILLHACCHNPSGADLSPTQWDKLATLIGQTGSLPLIDMAYQGFGHGVDEDAYGVRVMAASVNNMLLCSSCSKNFGLYRERIGACSLVASDPQQADTALSVMLYAIRCNYSMPPAHGAAIVATILANAELKNLWLEELALMRERINHNRTMLVTHLHEQKVAKDFSFIAKEKGMFSFLGINEQQVQQLKQQYGIYMVDSSRISIAGISHQNVDYLARAIAAVL